MYQNGEVAFKCWVLQTQHLGAFHGAEVPFVFADTFELGETTIVSATT